MVESKLTAIKNIITMSIKSVLLFAVVAMGHAIRSDESFHCGAPAPTEDQLDVMRGFATQEAIDIEAGNVTTMAITVPVWLHAISSTQGGLSSDATLQNQFNTLRDGFAPHGITLTYAGRTRNVNAQWANEGNGNEMAMKRALRKGNYRTMNFYIVDVLPSASGYCYYPTNAAPGSDAVIRDGCTLAKSAIGKIAVHEAGHWFGLIHTFQGNNCNGQGDLVADTPVQAGPSSGCPTGRDSCPGKPGLDPIHIFMDYSAP